MNFSTLAIKRHVFTYLTALSLMVIGFLLYFQMSVSYWPDFSAPVLLINTVYPGASATEVEDKLTKPIEKGVAGVSAVDEVESTSSEGNSSIIVRFNWGANIEKAATDIREKLDFIGGELPREAQRPNILKIQNLLPPAYQFTLESPNYSEDELKKLFDEKLGFYFLKLKDVAAVEVAGGREKFVAIEPIPEKMRAYRFEVETIQARLGTDNLDLPAGIIGAGKNEFILKTTARFETPQEIGNLVMDYRGSRPIYLRDVARIRYRYDPERTVFKLNGKRTLGVSLRKKNDGNAASLAADAGYEIGRIRKEYPSLAIDTIKDESRFIRVSIKNVVLDAILGSILAGFIIFLFLGNHKKAFIIIVSIPISVVTSFIFMRLFGLSINTISLGGLALAVGMIVDASIVMLENIERNLALFPDKPRLELFQVATAEVVLPISAGVITTVVVFLPLAFLEGIASVLLGELALTIVFTASVSLVVSLTIVPLLIFSWTRGPAKQSRLARPFQDFIQRMQDKYERSLVYMLQKKQRAIVVVSSMFLLFLVAMVLAGRLQTGLIPEPDEGEFRIETRLDPSTSVDTNKVFSEMIRRQLAGIPDIKDIYQVIGQSMSLSFPEPNVTTSFVILKSSSRPVKTIILDARTRLEKLPIPGLKFKIQQTSATEGVAKPSLDITVYSDDLERLAEESGLLFEDFKNYPGLANLDLSIKPGKTELLFIPRREHLAFYQIPVASLASRLRAHYAGIKAGRLKVGDENFDIKIIYPDADLSPHQVPVNSSGGQSLRLQQLVDFRLNPSPTSIKRMNQQRFAELKGDLLTGNKREFDRYVAAVVEKRGRSKDTRVEQRGVSKGISESFRSLGIALFLAIFLVYVVMGSQFNSFIQPFIISFTVPLAAIGVVLILWITRTPLNLNSFLGGVVLVGIVVDNGILIIDFINQKRKSLPFTEAIVSGSILRLRPILMTVLTTILGMLPLAIAWGEGAEALTPLARAVIGGLTFSTLTTLWVIPAFYFLLTPADK